MKKLVVCLIAVSGAATFAGEIAWRGGGNSPFWSDGTNWEGGESPKSGDTAVIPSGKTAYMSSTDVVLATALPLAGIRVESSDSELFITNNTVVTLGVPLAGVGHLKIANTMQRLTLAADNGNLTGPVTISNSYIYSDSAHADFLGRNNVITNYMGSGESLINFFKSGDYYNDWVVFGNESSPQGAANHAIVAFAGVTFKGHFYSRGSFNINSQTGYTTKFCGGVVHEGPYELEFHHKTSEAIAFEISGDTPVVSRTTTDYRSGLHFTKAASVMLSSRVANDGYRVNSNGNALYSRFSASGRVVCGAKNVLNGGVALQNGITTTGNSGGEGGMLLDLNGYDQSCGSMFRSSGIKLTHEKCLVTSARPATLTMRGQWEYYGNSPGSTDKTPMAVNDRASFEFWPTNFIRSGQSLAIKPKIWFTNTTWTTKGELACRRGTLTLDADVQMPNLGRMTISHEGRLVVKPGVAVNPDRFCLSITNVQATTASTYSEPLTIESGVLLKADRAFVEGKWLDRGTYGGQQALAAGLIDAEHVLPQLGGAGVLTVKRYGVAGFMFIVH